MIEAILGVAVVLIAAYVIATHRDRIRQLGAAITLGAAADSALPDLPTDSETHSDHGNESHPADSHWGASDAGPHDS